MGRFGGGNDESHFVSHILVQNENLWGKCDSFLELWKQARCATIESETGGRFTSTGTRQVESASAMGDDGSRRCERFCQPCKRKYGEMNG